MTLSEVLGNLNFALSDFKPKDHSLEYQSNLGTINFVELIGRTDAEIEENFFISHSEIWNENKSEIFVAIKGTEIFICDSKTKPYFLDSIKTAKIRSFGYGDNTPEARRYLELLRKENIDSGYFWEEIYKFIRERKRQPIDEDLLENLREKKEKISRYIRFGDRDETAQKLIDRCLFIRSVEDRIGKNELKNLLKDSNRNVDGLLHLFEYYNECLNGDLFERNDITSDIDERVLGELNDIFGEYYTYPSGQRTLAPYRFNKIPILLISHIYEQFLNPERRRGEGIVFTPENVVEYIIEEVFKSNNIKSKIKEGTITVLDPSCGSGIFIVKFFERLIEEKERILNKSLSLDDKTELLKNSVFGIDTDNKALRIAAFSLYLKIFEDVNPNIIEEEVFKKHGEGKKHFMFPGLKDHNLILGNSLFDDIFLNKKFDLIFGNPPWGYRFTRDEKRIIDQKWPVVADYQSSQCFLFKIIDWMKDDCIVGIVVNLSNFTNQKAEDFRKILLETYSIDTFLNLINIKKITFGANSEPACVLIFNKNSTYEQNEIEFIIPDLTQFSKLTKMIIIREDNMTKVPQKLLVDDAYWHLCIFGFNKYLKLIEHIEKGKYLFTLGGDYIQYLEDGKVDSKLKEAFKENKQTLFNNAKISKIDDAHWEIKIEGTRKFRMEFTGVQIKVYELLGNYSERFREGARLYSTGRHGDINSAKQFYESHKKEGNEYFPKISSVKGIRPYLCPLPESYVRYGPHLERPRDLDLFKGDKLVLTRTWPIKAFTVSDTIIFAESFDIFKLKKDYPPNYLFLFEAILNSKLAYFYLAAKYLQRPEGNFSKVNKKHLENFPVPDLIEKTVIRDIIQLLPKVKDEKDVEKYQDQIDNLVFDLYDLDYYERQQIKDYYKLQQTKLGNLVNKADMREYIDEFINSFSPFIEKDYFLGAEGYICDFLGSLVKFRFLKKKEEGKLESSDLKKLLGIIQYQRIRDIGIGNILKEKELRMYDENVLYIYKSNHPKDWTRTKALDDVKREVGIIYQNLPWS